MKEIAIHTINVYKSTKNRLKDLGEKDETYNTIIVRLLDHWDKTHKKIEEN